jgi:hypothetical protein
MFACCLFPVFKKQRVDFSEMNQPRPGSARRPLQNYPLYPVSAAGSGLIILQKVRIRALGSSFLFATYRSDAFVTHDSCVLHLELFDRSHDFIVTMAASIRISLKRKKRCHLPTIVPAATAWPNAIPPSLHGT